MDNLMKDKIKEISRYFEPERRIQQKQTELQQKQKEIQQILQKGGSSDTAKIIGGFFKATFTGISWLTSFGGKDTATLTNLFKMTGGGTNTLINAAGSSVMKVKIQSFESEIRNFESEIQKIQNGNVNRGITDKEFDGKVMDLVPYLVPNDLYEMALNRLNLDETQISEVEPIYFEDYFIDESNENQLKAIGKDKVVRTPNYQATWLFGTTLKLCVYQCTIDLFTGSYTETDDSYFWKKITKFSNVSTNQKSYFEIKGSNCEYKFIYKNNPDINQSIRGMKSYWDIKNE